MILIADSGSTKCDWMLYSDNRSNPIKIRTKGLNPAILSKKQLKSIITGNEDLFSYKDQVTSIHFFGAGCGTKKNQHKVNKILTSHFKNANASTHEDIMAAVYATTSTPAVVCILGTGSNCCYFDGKEAHLKSPALGYILMDEGSGNYFGKELLKAYYYKQMPEALRVRFEKAYNLKEREVVKQLYKSTTPNKYLADFARFLFENETHPFIKKVLLGGMTVFIENHILQHKEELKTVPLHFVGSIAYFAQDYIQQALSKKGLKATHFIRRPIDNIIDNIVNEPV
ncbi:N-acetylglucosamine kinase [Seonamhaeicola sp.]|uniref:N-acetylglucosamine kinase n=1 Tax=Seonamhaeicola sp. TaxID=1912245 RepID=UPI002637CA10|nr:N-acetylglucosamine kinase [Seonamhaeicola sp.]